MTLEEAADLLRLKSPHRLVQIEGLEITRPASMNQNTPKVLVRADSVLDERSRRMGAVGLSQMASEFGIGITPLSRAVEALKEDLGVTIRREDLGYMKVWVTPDDHRKLKDWFAKRGRFVADHMTVDDAASQLGRQPRTIRQLIDEGVLVESKAPDSRMSIGLGGGHQARWITRESVIQATDAGYGDGPFSFDEDERPSEDAISDREAAKLMTRSSINVRHLARQGKIERIEVPGSQRYWLSKESVKAFLAPQPRR